MSESNRVTALRRMVALLAEAQNIITQISLGQVFDGSIALCFGIATTALVATDDELHQPPTEPEING